MSYTPTNWQTGDIITAEKLNKLENGVAGGGSDVFEVNFTVEVNWETEPESYIATSNKTYAEIDAANNENKKIIAWMRYIDFDFDSDGANNLAIGYRKTDDDDANFVFYFVDDTNVGATARTNIVLGPETLTVEFTIEGSPIFISGEYHNGSAFNEANYKLFWKAVNSGVPFYIDIEVRSSGESLGYGTFIFSPNYPASPGWRGGYCFAGAPAVIGSTAQISFESGSFVVTPPNS